MSSLFELKKNLSPEKFAKALSKKGDLFWWEAGNFWVITQYSLAKTLLTGSDVTCDRAPFFISRMPDINLSLLPDFFDVVGQMMVMKDNKAHQSSRRICYHGFAKQQLDQIEPSIKQTVATLIQQLHEKNTFDFCEDFANILPMKTLADFFNIPESERNEFVKHAKTMTAFFGGASSYQDQDAINVNYAAKSLKDYFKDLYKQRKLKPEQDFFSQLINQQKAFNLSQDDIIAQAIMMWVAGMVTTSDQLSNNFYTLVSDFPEIIADTPSFSEYLPLIQECNRLDPSVTFTFRLANKDIVIDDRIIKKGDTIFISNHAANRDQRIFNVPDRVHIDQKEKHLSYGYGAHYCLGAKLSLMEMQHAFYQLFKHFPSMQLIESQRLHYSLSFSGFEKLIVNKYF